MAQHIELNPVTHMTIGAVGEPGRRVFYLQGGKGRDLVSLVIEKHQAVMLVDGLESLLEELGQGGDDVGESLWVGDAGLREPLEVLFRVGQMRLGFSEETGRVVLVAYELVEEGEVANVVSFWASQRRMRGLIPHITAVVKAGRPICGNCGQAIDREGHFCPRRNGHLH